MRQEIVVGTRGSQLALAQTNLVMELIKERCAGCSITVKKIRTTGDKILDSPLAKIGDKGLFVKEIEQALLSGDVDLAVHSMKDIPTEVPAGLKIAAALEREDPRDALVSRTGAPLADLPTGAVIGTSSLRRKAQLLHLRPDFRFTDLRGNVDTRLKKLAEEELDAIVLSGAGLARLGLTDRITERIPPEVILPAVGQGSIALEVKADDTDMLELAQSLNHSATWQAVAAERALLRFLEGGCQVPLGALGEVHGRELTLSAAVAAVDGTKLVRDSITGSADKGEALGTELAGKLLDQGAQEILREIR